MSRINAVRIINLSYNNDGMKVDDELFQLNNESSLLSLRNGGGKSVLVQMLTAPFVHKRYRDNRERKFSSYFTSNQPTIIMVEWELDGNSGYVLTGMIVRKNQAVREDEPIDELEILQFIHEYKGESPYDIRSIPFVKEGEKRILKNFASCKNLLEAAKQDRDYIFYLYDMNNYAASKNYYSRLEDYRIYYKEWESIIKRVNLKESGLSEFFSNNKDETSLIKEWFLPTIENKLKKDKDRIHEFREILFKYIQQYKNNQAKISQKEKILLFQEETGQIKDMAEGLQAKHDRLEAKGNEIANLIRALQALEATYEEKVRAKQEEVRGLKEAIDRINYEEASLEIYRLKDEKETLEEAMDDLAAQITDLEKDRAEWTRKKNIQTCARLYENYIRESTTNQNLQARLDLEKLNQEEQSAERESLGYSLRLYYEKETGQYEQRIDQVQGEIQQKEEQIQAHEIEKEGLDREKESLIVEESSLKTKIDSYDEVEQDFNRRYDENFSRSITGTYEDESLTIKKNMLQKELEEANRQLKNKKNLQLENEEKIKEGQRSLQEQEAERGRVRERINHITQEIEVYDKEIEARKIILQYIEFDDHQIFQREEILDEIQKKIDRIGLKRTELTRDLDSLQKEYKKLKSGQVIRLPKDFEDALDAWGLSYKYGMEWLQKNNFSLERNQELIERNPFIPYAILMNAQDLSILQQKKLDIYTSFPIPIVCQESLVKADQVHLPGDQLSFYLLFNKNLLNEEELKKILQGKEEEMTDVESRIKIRDEEEKNYRDKQGLVKFQNVTEKIYKSVKAEKLKQEERLATCEDQIKNIRLEEEEGQRQQEKIKIEIRGLEGEIGLKIQKLEALQELMRKYEIYLENRRNNERTVIAKDKIQDRIKLLVRNIGEETRARENVLEAKREIAQALAKSEEKLEAYIIHKEATIIDRDFDVLESRYRALTEGVAGEIKDLEQSLMDSSIRFGEIEAELDESRRRFGLVDQDYTEVHYDRFTLRNYEQGIESKSKAMNIKSNAMHGLNGDIKVKENQIHTAERNLQELGYTSPILRKDIIDRDFKKYRAELLLEKFSLEQEEKKLENKLANYQQNQSILAEYDHLALQHELLIVEEIEGLGKEGLEKYRAIQTRDYRTIQDEIGRGRLQASQETDRLLRIEAFGEDFFKKPLENLAKLIENPSVMIEQLATTLKAYEDLMRKLEVDIAIIGKEQERILEMLLAYVQEVHKNMGQIDKNSSIKIRERTIKMLKINQPDWETGFENYKIKLKDMIEGLTASAMSSLERNEPVDNLISVSINTENLYHHVVGIRNIEIKLYKIEAGREVLIQWSDVAKNSGGEGFLSAFAVLSSLLSFMRRKDSDLFGTEIEGKVLLMDNPFAQTHSEHLLKPLMELARINNTQLICFTGIGAEAIYNSFDNIYVLNLIPSKLHRGIEYLRADHTKGQEYEAITSARIQTTEGEQIEMGDRQAELLF